MTSVKGERWFKTKTVKYRKSQMATFDKRIYGISAFFFVGISKVVVLPLLTPKYKSESLERNIYNGFGKQNTSTVYKSSETNQLLMIIHDLIKVCQPMTV